MKIVGFDWSNGNNEKIKKHGVSSRDIEDFFVTGDPFIYADHLHSKDESRFLAFATYKNRPIFAVFTFRAINGLLKIRVISARYAHEKEVRKFNEKKSNN